MNAAVRRFFQGIPICRDLCRVTRQTYNRRRFIKAGAKYFINFDECRGDLEAEDGRSVDVRTKGGLILTIRRNYLDAAILAEIFVDNCYVQGLSMRDQPIVVDIGGYIGDFAVYAAKRLQACKIVVYEPSVKNWALLMKNISNNHFEDRIEAVNKAVTDGGDVLMNVDASDRGQARVSAYGPENRERQRIPGIALASLVADHGLNEIDLLKIDCEGGEYTILLTTPTEVFNRIRNIVFEFHEIEGFEAKLAAVKQRLWGEGYFLKTHGSLIFASRE